MIGGEAGAGVYLFLLAFHMASGVVER